MADSFSLKPFWEHAYRAATKDPHATTELVVPFPGRPDKGADKLLYRSNGRIVRVDEKIHVNRGYTDDYLFLEFEHESATDGYTSPGWVCDPFKRTDLIAYAKEALFTVFVLPYAALCEAWHEHNERWKAQYRTTATTNEGYVSRCLLVPASELAAVLDWPIAYPVPEELWK